MSRLKQLISEIHRRSLWRVLGIYLGSSWLVFEVVQTLTEGVWGSQSGCLRRRSWLCSSDFRP